MELTKNILNYLIKYYISIISAICILYTDMSAAQANNQVHDFSEYRLRRHINFLANDLFEGRAVGSTGANLSAKYLADKFDEIGLRPIGTNYTYYQYIPMHGSTPLPESELKIITDSLEYSLDLGADFLMFNAGEQAFLAGEQELIFVGYGINAMEFDYSDYFNIDVEGKIVVFLSGEPASNSEAYFNGDKPSKYSSPAMKQRTAMALGAKGTILISDQSDFNSAHNNKYLNTFAFENVNLAYSPASNLNLLMPPDKAQVLFENSAYSLREIFALESKNQLHSFALNSKISFTGKFKERDFISPNIVGLLPANSPNVKDEFIIVSAHYDHLGIGPAYSGDSIYNGALDNAIGCAGLIELAEYLTKAEIKLNRSILFILTTGEEKGLLGSSYYTDNPLVPLYKTIANINIDGMAFIDEFNSIVPIGSEQSELAEIIRFCASNSNLKIEPIPEEFTDSEAAFAMSDQAAFAAGGIPSVLIMDGTEYKNITKAEGIARLIDYSNNKYHTPADDLSISINFNATKQHLTFIRSLLIYLANSETTPPEWHSGSSYSNERLRSRAEKR